MPLTDPELWKLIENWPLPYRQEIDEKDPLRRLCYRFEHNLRAIEDWTDEAANDITAAYRRFLYLKAVTGKALTPPAWIDQAWHLHMEFPENYAALEAAVGRSIPHILGLSKVDRNDAFDCGRKHWIAEFDFAPDKTTWPSREQLRRETIGGYVGACGFAFWGIGCFILMPIWGEVPTAFASLGLGLTLFVGGGAYGGRVGPPRVSRCG